MPSEKAELVLRTTTRIGLHTAPYPPVATKKSDAPRRCTMLAANFLAALSHLLLHQKYSVSPSILSANFATLGQQVCVAWGERMRERGRAVAVREESYPLSLLAFPLASTAPLQFDRPAGPIPPLRLLSP